MSQTASTEFSLHRFSGRPFKPSRRADDLTEQLMRQLGLPDKATVVRLAIGRSLATQQLPKALPDDESTGREIKGMTLFGEDLPLWIALVVEHAQMDSFNEKEVVDLIRRHWHRGCENLWKEWSDSEKRLDAFLTGLAERAALPNGPSPTIGPDDGPSDFLMQGAVKLRLGEIGVIDGTGETAEWVLNASGLSPHLAIFGKSGKGKTRTAKDIFRQVARYQLPLLIFDPKGDFKDDKRFAQDIGAQVCVVGVDPIPLNGLAPASSENSALIRAADGFVEALERAIPELGPKQTNRLRDVVKRELANSNRIHFEDIVAGVEREYKQNKLKTDVLTAALSKLRDYKLFTPELTAPQFFSRSWIISANDAQDEALRFTLLFILDALLRFLRSSSDSPQSGDGHRAMRLMLASDEARRIFELASPTTLEGLVLECRSKGLSCFFLSQSPDHVERASDDLLGQFEVVASFEADLNSSRIGKRLFGNGFDSSDLSRLPRGHCLARLPGRLDAVEIRAWE